MSCLVHSAVCLGLNVYPVTIEAALGSGFSGVQLIGVPQDYARDAKERIRAALESLGFTLPARRLVVSFRPIDTLKQFKGGLEHLDLPCAIAILAALAEQSTNDKRHSKILTNIAEKIRAESLYFAGQLTLSGELLPPEQSLPFELLICDSANPNAVFWSALKISQIKHAPERHFATVRDLRDCLQKLSAPSTRQDQNKNIHVSNDSLIACEKQNSPDPHIETETHQQLKNTFDKFIQTPVLAVGLALAAAGRQHILLAGSPGCGKTYALRHLTELLPALTRQQQLEVALIHQRDNSESARRPFRHPHHSASAAALLGGSLLQPGEVSLAHHGLLFLDELAEFPRPALEALREPLDEKKITLSRSRGRIDLPADFLLAAATNPCACGYFFSKHRSCRCVGNSPLKYQQKLSGPLLERFSILLLLDEVLESRADEDNTTPTSLSRLARHWQDAYLVSPEQWIRHFISVQKTLWFSRDLNGSTPLFEQHVETLKTRGEQRHFSARSFARLKELLRTASALFPIAAADWQSDNFIEAIEQLRGFESALQKGVSFLTPTLSGNFLKDPPQTHDTI